MSRDIETYTDIAQGATQSVPSEVAMLTGLLKAGWEVMSETSRKALLSHQDAVMTHAAATGFNDSDDEGYVAPAGIDDLLSSASQHGEDSDEPEHEVGDVQQYLFSMERVMSGTEWEAFQASDAAQAVAALGSPAPGR